METTPALSSRRCFAFGLSTDTTVTDPSGIEIFDFQPRSFEQALGEAIAEENASRQTTSLPESLPRQSSHPARPARVRCPEATAPKGGAARGPRAVQIRVSLLWL
jgi:hypothetical protein